MPLQAIGTNMVVHMRRRLTFGPILVIILLGLMYLDFALTTLALPAGAGWLNPRGTNFPPGLVLLLLGMLAGARGGYELARLFRACGIAASSRHLTQAAAAGVLIGGLTTGIGEAAMVGQWAGPLLGTAAGLVVFLSMGFYIRDKDLKGAAGAAAAAVFTFVYMGVVLGFLLAIRREYSIGVMLAVIVVVKACDSGAYFTGTALGKHKLIRFVSPGKTWEGLIGGLVTAAAFGVGLLAVGKAYYPESLGTLVTLSYWQAGLIGVLLGATGQAGDLSASVVKRDAGVKDSGAILPGFGGMLDMLDSLLISAPLAWWLFHVMS